MSDRYKGAILSPTAPTVTPQSAGGIYTSSQQLQYQGQGVWPTAFNNPINNSLRFRASAGAYLNRTFSSGDQQKFTLSLWVKRGTTGMNRIFTCGSSGSSYFQFRFNSDDTILVSSENTSLVLSINTSQVFRDYSAWYHLILAVDTTQATASNRVRLYVNGTEVTAFSSATYPSQNTNLLVNSNIAHYIGELSYALTNGYDGYMTEINFVNAVQLTPSSFGTTDAYGIWQPIPYTGAYGTNGFYLPFTDNSALTTSSNVGLGKDFSGNGNYWVTNNISITAGSTYDSMKDVPTNTNSNTANYATLNPLAMYGTNVVISNANLTSSATTPSNDRGWASTIAAPNSGKWYAEFTFTSTLGDNNGGCGVMLENGTGVPGESATTVSWRDAGTLRQNATNTSYGSALTTNDVVIVAYDAASGSVWFGKNGTWFASGNPATNANPSATGITTSGRFATYHYNASAVIQANFGQRPFAYTPPTGFLPLNTYNLPTPTILAGNQYFNAVLRNGYGSSGGTLDCGFQPDWVWEKTRNAASSHTVWDSVRGLPNALRPNETTAELSQNWLTGFVSNGLTFGTNDYGTGTTLVEWVWKANQGNNITNTQGTITSTVSANTTAGFSIVTYTGTGSNATIGHGLGVAPSFIIAKARNSAQRWTVYTAALGNGYYGYLNETFAFDTANASLRWNTAPTSSVFGVGTSVDVNNNTTTYVAYCFSQVAGYSAFGSYTGNGSTDGPFVYTGFRPKFVIVKNTVDPNNWVTFDSARNTYNIVVSQLYPNTSDAEVTGSSTNGIDFLSNGFKVRSSFNWGNRNGDTIIYMAFAENPFKIARGR